MRAGRLLATFADMWNAQILKHRHSAAQDSILHVVYAEPVLQIAFQFSEWPAAVGQVPISDFYHPNRIVEGTGEASDLHVETSKVLNMVLGEVGTSHDHNVMSLVGLHVPTMSNKVSCLFDVDITRLQHTRDVTLASSEAFHQRTNLGMLSVIEMLCKLLWAKSSCDLERSCPSSRSEMLRESLVVYTGGPSAIVSALPWW